MKGRLKLISQNTGSPLLPIFVILSHICGVPMFRLDQALPLMKATKSSSKRPSKHNRKSWQSMLSAFQSLRSMPNLPKLMQAAIHTLQNSLEEMTPPNGFLDLSPSSSFRRGKTPSMLRNLYCLGWCIVFSLWYYARSILCSNCILLLFVSPEML